MSDSPPLTNDEVRRRRLMQLVGFVEGGLPAIAAGAGVSAQNLDHFVKRRLQSTVRADGSQPPVGLGDKVARQIEAAFELGAGWMDWPFERVDFASYAALDAAQRTLVQGRMIAAIEQATTQHIASPKIALQRQQQIDSVSRPQRQKTVGGNKKA